MTRRERMEQRQERREEWAEKREESADAAFERARTMSSAIPFGQPVLTDHHSERRDRNYRARIDNTTRRGLADARMAEHHANRATGIAHQLDTSVFSDDVDAIEQLRERIVAREARRNRIKAYNASCRKGKPDPSLLTDHECEELASTRRVAACMLNKSGGFPTYVLTNLGAAIRKDKERITDIERRETRTVEAESNGGVAVRVVQDYCMVTFAEKPAREIINVLKSAGFCWGDGSWCGRVTSLSEVTDDGQSRECQEVLGAIRAAIVR